MSVLKYDFKDFEDWDKYEHLNIDVDDVEDENLLGEFEKSGSWIEWALKEGRDGKKGVVLVHWYVADVPSSALVLQPYLCIFMEHLRESFEQVLLIPPYSFLASRYSGSLVM